MTQALDLFDIQGDVVRPYGRFGFPVARYVFFNIRDGEKGRAFVAAIATKVTTAATWDQGPQPIPRPQATTNIAFTYQGLKELELPRSSLIGFPEEFAMGMKQRKDILGDDGPSAPEHWDPIWRANREKDRNQDVHLFVSINAQDAQFLEERYQWLCDTAARFGDGVAQLRGHRGDNGAQDLPYQDVHALAENGQLTSKEHFGYTDGIGDPYFEGLADSPERLAGRGKQMDNGQWAPLATGEFILGHIDEAHEYPPAPQYAAPVGQRAGRIERAGIAHHRGRIIPLHHFQRPARIDAANVGRKRALCAAHVVVEREIAQHAILFRRIAGIGLEAFVPRPLGGFIGRADQRRAVVAPPSDKFRRQ